jgi:hypothetical protein
LAGVVPSLVFLARRAAGQHVKGRLCPPSVAMKPVGWPGRRGLPLGGAAATALPWPCWRPGSVPSGLTVSQQRRSQLNAVRSRPETDGIVGESNLAKTGGTQARAVHGTIASNADQRSKTNAQARAACSSLVYPGRFQINNHYTKYSWTPHQFAINNRHFC